ncbi:MAG: DUF1616 domain-containing protein [Candidatus Hydrothermarchaeales archaeon]
MGIVYFFPDTKIRIVLGLLFVLFFPGYALVAALFPRMDDIDWIERTAISFGSSIALVILIGLILNYTPWGIRLYPVAVSLFFFVFVLSLIAVHRRRALPPEERFSIVFKAEFKLPRWREFDRVEKALFLVLIVSFLVASVYIYGLATNPPMGNKFTEFYVLGEKGWAADYPVKAVLGEDFSVTVGIISHEYEEEEYIIKIIQGEETLNTLEGIVLQHEETWERNVSIVPTNSGEDVKFEFLLFKEGVEGPYRTLHLWVDVVEGE